MLAHNFETLCNEAGIPATKRQRSKFEKSFGMAFHAKELRLIEKHNALMESASGVQGTIDNLKTAILNRHKLGRKNVTYLIASLRQLRQIRKTRNDDYNYSKSQLPKYSRHIGG